MKSYNTSAHAGLFSKSDAYSKSQSSAFSTAQSAVSAQNKRFLISWFSDEKGMICKTVEGESENLALKSFFQVFAVGYSKDDEGFAYFRDDFYDKDRPMGSVSELD